MNHETRIKNLEKEIIELKEIVAFLQKKEPKFMPLNEGALKIGTTRKVIYDRIKKGVLEKGKDFKMHGTRYLINVDSVSKKIC